MKKIAFIIASTAILSACGGGEPSDTEIADALKKQVAEQIANSNGMLEEEDTKLNSSKKIGCTKGDGDSGYTCDVEIDMTVPALFGGNQKGIKPVRFVKSDDGWSAIQERK